MTFTSHTAWRFASTLAKGTALVATSIYITQTTLRIAASSKLGVVDEVGGPPSFIDSPTIRNHVNPHDRSSRVVDTHAVTLDVPLRKHVSDEMILARATKSFFHGWVFSLEARALRLIRLQDSKYTSMFPPNLLIIDAEAGWAELASTTVPAHVWDAAEISDSALPELHTVLFGVFRLADVHLADVAGSGSNAAESHADFLFGSDGSQFAGCHRLSVERLQVDAAGETQKVKVQLQCYACNPQSDDRGSRLLYAFHRFYATALFRETAGEVHRWLHSGR
ncbi:hypothetical protein CCM_09220 [Cordyceps militaris CM01]|uniref:Uncharacterized protein n=1 Tax=Cordyceps militaris (strain CM01) TaxID=983644 RepID=G3JTT0_CORMM|nr:uncharacterized protein CCM_09220 [Cordyceps militaris CM01]EGX88084.1 hypothetical protein CCM_09220 [Cordyceps militaris CM01]